LHFGICVMWIGNFIVALLDCEKSPNFGQATEYAVSILARSTDTANPKRYGRLVLPGGFSFVREFTVFLAATIAGG
jgi:hypothetical protein